MESATIRPLIANPPTKSDYASLAIIVAIGAAVRFMGLTVESLWGDEAFAAYAASLSTIGDVMEFARTDVHPPGFLVALWMWGNVFGQTDYGFRSFAAVGGVMLVPVVFRIGRQLFNSRIGLLAGFLAALSIQSIYFSQEVRSYSWIATLSALSVSIALDQVSRPAPWRLLMLVAITSTLSYFHYFGLLFAAVLWVFVVASAWRAKGPVFQAIAGAVTCAALFSPWIPTAIASFGQANWIPRSDVRFVLELFNIYYGPGLWVDLVALLLLVGGLGFAWKRSGLPRLRVELGLIAWIVVPLAIALGISLLVRPIYSPRNMLIGAGAAIILLARSVDYLGGTERAKWAIAGLAAISFCLIHFAFGNGFLVRPTKQQLREAAAFIDANNADALPIYTVDWDEINFGYYLSKTDQRERMKSITARSVNDKGLVGTVSEQRFWIASAGIDINLLLDVEKEYRIEKQGEFLLARAYLLQRISRKER